jgi:AcrR family transcriptional regulator
LAQILKREGYDYIVDLIARDITAAAERGGPPVRDARAVARMIVGALSGVQMQERHSDPAALSDLATRLVDVVLSGRAAW